MILKLIDELIDSEPRRIKRTKGSKPSLLSNRKNYFTIRAKTYDRLQKLDLPQTPSRNHFHNTLNDLQNWNIITHDPDKKNEFKVTDLGHICNTFNYDPKDYLKLHLACAYICFRAATGILLGIDGRNNDLKSKQIVSSEREMGITAEDILEYKCRINIPYINSNKIEVSPDEMKEYFNMLKDLEILKKTGDVGNERYILSQKYKEFILKSTTIFVNLLKQRMEYKWTYIHRPIPKELEWYQTIFGIHITKENTSKFAEYFKENKKYWSEQKKKWEQELLNYNKHIIADYKELKNISADLDEIPGFIDTIISFGCQKDLIDLIRSEYNQLLKINS